MVRRLASQVHKQASRLLRADYLKRRPAWYEAVLEHPPLPLPPREPPNRSDFDLPEKQPTFAPKAPPSPRPKPVTYLEDGIRRQFFRDHPFETFRPISLVEEGAIEEEHPIRGAEWTRLKQRSRNPTPEDAVRFAVTLHQHHAFPLTEAYKAAVLQFRALRSEFHIASAFAAQEAEAYGAQFGPSWTEQAFAEEGRVIAARQGRTAQMDAKELAARKRWRMEAPRARHAGEWSKGQEYVRLWKEGVRPDYSPALTEPIAGNADVGAGEVPRVQNDDRWIENIVLPA